MVGRWVECSDLFLVCLFLEQGASVKISHATAVQRFVYRGTAASARQSLQCEGKHYKEPGTPRRRSARSRAHGSPRKGEHFTAEQVAHRGEGGGYGVPNTTRQGDVPGTHHR